MGTVLELAHKVMYTVCVLQLPLILRIGELPSSALH